MYVDSFVGLGMECVVGFDVSGCCGPACSVVWLLACVSCFNRGTNSGQTPDHRWESSATCGTTVCGHICIHALEIVHVMPVHYRSAVSQISTLMALWWH